MKRNLVAAAWLMALTACGGTDPVKASVPGVSDANTLGGNSPTVSALPPPPTVPTQAAPTAADPNTFYGGASRCAAANVQFCESWESLAPGASPNPNTWTVVLANTQHSIAVSNTRAARGSNSLLVHVPNAFPMSAMMFMDSVFPAPNNTLYGRVFMYFDHTAPGGHTTLIRATGPDGAAQETIQFGDMFTNYVANWGCPSPSADNGGYSKVPLPTKRWVCLEWAHKGDAGELDVWADGQPIFTMTDQWVAGSTLLAGPHPAYNQFGMGWEVYEQFGNDDQLPAYDIYFDELALDPNRIGCER